MYSEEEARTKWCPFARNLTIFADDASVATAANRGAAETIKQCHCIASECMAWRWEYADHFTHIGTGQTKGGKRTELGYCGLAGRPE